MTKTRYRIGRENWPFGKPVLILQVLDAIDMLDLELEAK